MTDIFTKKKRSWVMSRIRSKNTKMENTLAIEMKKAGIKFKRYPKIYGSPDFIANRNTLIFIDGCFWHRCPKHYTEPKSRKGFWVEKLGKNVERDKEVTRKLRKMGYNVVRIWEHEMEKRPEHVVKMLVKKMSETI